jgi:hypothetical protein
VAPLKPASSVPASIPQPSGKSETAKSGTTIVKSAPPKETARITVKPNLPPTAVRAGGNFPTAKPAAGAVPVAAVAGAVVAGAAVVAKAAVAKPAVAKPGSGSKPATTIVKTGTAKVAPTAVKSAAAAPAVAATSTQFQEEGSTTLTTALAGALALLTWATAGVLIASYLALI